MRDVKGAEGWRIGKYISERRVKGYSNNVYKTQAMFFMQILLLHRADITSIFVLRNRNNVQGRKSLQAQI